MYFWGNIFCMRKSTVIVLLLLTTLLWVSTSCKKNDHQSCHVAMLAQGITFDDQAFLQSCKNGLEQAKKDFDLICEYNIDTTTTRYRERLEYYAGLDFNLIIAVGYMWNDAVVQASKEYPDIDFVLVDAALSEQQENTLSILFDVDEVAYPLGYLSAWWAWSHDSTDPAVGFVGALEIPQIRQFTEPFLIGVDHFNQDYSAVISHSGFYASTFIDTDLGEQLADSLITLGADVIFGVGGQTGNGALLMANERGKWGIGVDVDQSVSIPEVSGILISSAMKRLDNAIYAVIQSYIENNFNGHGIYTGNLANEGVDMAPYHDFESQIPDSIADAIDSIKAGIINGTIVTGWQNP